MKGGEKNELADKAAEDLFGVSGQLAAIRDRTANTCSYDD